MKRPLKPRQAQQLRLLIEEFGVARSDLSASYFEQWFGQSPESQKHVNAKARTQLDRAWRELDAFLTQLTRPSRPLSTLDLRGHHVVHG